MISLNTPFRSGDGQLLDMFGKVDDPSVGTEHADELAGPLARLKPVERALLVAVYAGDLDVTEAARRLNVSPLAISRRLGIAQRKARGRRGRSSGTPAPGAGTERPIGFITIKKFSRKRKARFIKVAMRPPRWEPYARWLWEQRNGPIPNGKLVLHKDGNPLNDDPGNLILGGHADRAFLFQSRSDANYRTSMNACREGCKKHNRERAIARDLLGELRNGYWYAVDHDERRIIGPFGRKCGEAYQAFGVPVPPGINTSPMPWLASQLGWPGVPFREAITLAALATRAGSSMNRAEIAAIAEPLSARLGRPIEANCDYLTQALYGARKRGLLVSHRGGRLAGGHAITMAGLGTRGPVCLLAILRGRDCQSLKLDGYAVVSKGSEQTQ